MLTIINVEQLTVWCLNPLTITLFMSAAHQVFLVLSVFSCISPSSWTWVWPQSWLWPLKVSGKDMCSFQLEALSAGVCFTVLSLCHDYLQLHTEVVLSVHVLEWEQESDTEQSSQLISCRYVSVTEKKERKKQKCFWQRKKKETKMFYVRATKIWGVVGYLASPDCHPPPYESWWEEEPCSHNRRAKGYIVAFVNSLVATWPEVDPSIHWNIGS